MSKVVQFSENQRVYSSRDGEMKLEPDKFYKVTKGNTDRSVLIAREADLSTRGGDYR